MDEAFFHQQQLEQQYIESLPAYCDYIAHRIKKTMNDFDPEMIIAGCGRVHHDVVDDKLISSTKRMYVSDMNGKHYRITVEVL